MGSVRKMTAEHTRLLTLLLAEWCLLPCLATKATCDLTTSGSLTGTIAIQGDSTATHFRGKISGLAPGKHGFHVHQFGDLSDECRGAGGHFNPFSNNHGGSRDRVRHVGDLGNIEVSSSGLAVLDIHDRLALLDGPASILGKAIVIHEGPDDLGRGGDQGSLKTGNAGARLGCCVIRETVPVFSVKYFMSLLSNWNIIN